MHRRGGSDALRDRIEYVGIAQPDVIGVVPARDHNATIRKRRVPGAKEVGRRIRSADETVIFGIVVIETITRKVPEPRRDWGVAVMSRPDQHFTRLEMQHMHRDFRPTHTRRPYPGDLVGR